MNEHKIETIVDLANVVNADNLEALCEDMFNFLSAVAFLKGSNSGGVIPTNFIWIDDGQNKGTANLFKGDETVGQINFNGGVVEGGD